MGEGDGYSSEQWDRIIAAVHRILAAYPPYPGTKTWYVDQAAGNDTTGDGSEDFPYKTVAYCLTKAGIRDTIIGWGAFTEAVNVTKAQVRFLGLGPGLSSNIIPGAIPFSFGPGGDGCELAGFLLSPNNVTMGCVVSNNVDYLKIHDNLLIGPADDGVSLYGDNVGRHIIERNTIYNCTTHGIEVGGLVGQDILNTIIRDNRITLCGTGIYANTTGPGTHRHGWIYKNRITDMTANGIQLNNCDNFLVEKNTVVDALNLLVDNLTTNYWINNEFHNVISGTHTTVGVIEETVFTELCVQPNTRMRGYLRVNNLVAGDDFIFRVLKSHDGGVNFDIIDETQLVGAQLIDRYPYDIILEDALEQVTVTIDRQSGTDRSFFHKRIVSNE